MESDFAQGFVNSMLGWMRSLAAAVANMFRTGSGSQSGGFSMLEWFKGHWLGLLVALVLLGVIIDWVVWLLRWRPYWLWFKKRRLFLDDTADEPVYYEPKDRFHSRALKYDEDEYGEDEEDGEYDEDYGYDDEEYDGEDYGEEAEYDEYDEADEPDPDKIVFDDIAQDDEDEEDEGGVLLFDDAASESEENDGGKNDVLSLFEDGGAKETQRFENPDADKLELDFDADEYYSRDEGFTAKDCAAKSRKARRREKGGGRDDAV